MPLFLLPMRAALLLRKRAVQELFEATAAAFGCEAPSPDGLSADEYLGSYALFTRYHALRALRTGQESAVQGRLYESAYRLGDKYRRLLHIRNLAGVMATARLLYRVIGIDLQGYRDGRVVIRRCFFSRYYTAQVCRVMSAMDSGLLAGLAGGGALTFQQRLTEGQPCCCAQFRLEKEKP